VDKPPSAPPEPEEDSPAGASTDDAPLDDARTERAVDDIVARESDEVLEAEDAAREADDQPPHGFWRSVGHFFGRWFGTPKGRWLTFFLLVAAAAAVVAFAPARYWVLNTAGVRAGFSVVVVDELTQLPLKGVDVRLDSRTRQTAADGRARFEGLRLGAAQLSIAQPGFAAVQQGVTIGLGSNPLGLFALKATGARYTIMVHDYLSDKPLAGVLATSGQATALSDATGKIVLTLGSLEAAQAPVTLSKDGYRAEHITLKPANQPTAAALVSSRKVVFVSKASGRYDLYKSDVDGANREPLLRGTGNENGNIGLAVSPDGTRAALVSTRDDQHDGDGFLLSTLTLVTVADGTAVTLAHAEQLQLLDWVGSRLIFEQVSTDPGTPPSGRFSVISYDYTTNSRLQLAAAPKLNAVLSAQSAIYYAVAVNDANGSLQPGLYRVGPDGGSRQRVVDQEVWSGLRTDYRTLTLQTDDGWLTYDIAGNSHRTIDGPQSFTSRLYADNAAHTRSLWINQGVLLSYDAATGKDSAVQAQNGLNYPLRWFTDDVVIYRVVTSGESADYAKSLSGGTPHKISDVAVTTGFTSGQ
jgi:hypothetical protein